ncbi:MAG: hypothetical protein J0I33_01295 [Microbacterium ginsengisoli]|uniref:DUF6993 domain-containing protein n=1 Tax=Microbacterium TaxID=33882 RepID=UPI001910C097|nr:MULTISPECIES: hypothetical protein [unclassified Microbacterium]MBN9197266.1 hypothetical protein [Microbacterium ginsengisoli]
MTRFRSSVQLIAAGCAAGALALLAGCTSTPAPSPTPSVAVSSATPTSTPTASGPVAFVPGGTAQQNLPIFAQTVASVWSGPDQVHGRAYIDALVADGFSKADMQVTNDETTIGRAVESLQFSVRLGDECLIGQVGPTIASPVTEVAPGLVSGGCLIGQTRPINW